MTTTRRYKQNKTNPEKKGNKKNTTEENNNKTTDICSFVYWFFKSIFRPLLLPSESTWMPWEIIKYNTHTYALEHTYLHTYITKSRAPLLCVGTFIFPSSFFISKHNQLCKVGKHIVMFRFLLLLPFPQNHKHKLSSFFLFNERYTVYIHILYIVGLLPKLAKSIFDRFCYRNVGFNFSPYK